MASARLKLLDEHGREAEIKGAEFRAYGWVSKEHSIMSKTSKGFLENQISPETMFVAHRWTPYDGSAGDPESTADTLANRNHGD
jgi:hypothetical protein